MAGPGSRKKRIHTGSLKKSEPGFLIVGRLTKPHGIKGEVHFFNFSNVPKILKPADKVCIGEYFSEFEILSIKNEGEKQIIQFYGIDTREKAEKISGQFLLLPRDKVPDLNENQYYEHDLIGMIVQNESGEKIGVLHSIIHTGSNDVYVIHQEGKENGEILIPAIRSVILEVKIENKSMTVQLPQWL